MKRAYISAIEYHLPERILDNQEISHLFPEWSADQIERKTGIKSRRIAAADETASDLAVKAAERLFAVGKADPRDVEFILFCTQAPDYYLPTSACVMQHRLGIPKSAGALDFNLGCSGFIYGLSLAKGLIESGQVNNVLLLTADTYSKFVDPNDKSVISLFGDGASATFIKAREWGESQQAPIGPIIFGTDGSGAEFLSVHNGAMRSRCLPDPSEGREPSNTPVLRMDGPAIFSFSLREVPHAVNAVMSSAGISSDDVDLYIFHQANAFMLETLRKSMKLPVEKFIVNMAEKGNTVSSTIPIAIADAQAADRLKAPVRLMLVGFGVGLSWAASLAWLPHAI